MHDKINRNKAVFISFDLESGGEYCGPVQFSAEIFRMNKSSNGNTWNTIRSPNIFNKYIKPSDIAIWNDHATQIHGLHASHPSIQSAQDMKTVWNEWEIFIDNEICTEEIGILIAYNGESCDLKWLWKLTQSSTSKLNMPPQVKHFLDPLKVIREYKSCPINSKNSKLESYELGVVWSYLHNGDNFNGAHDSLADAKAQTDIVISDSFGMKFIDRTKSIRRIQDLFTKTEVSEMRKTMEPLREVHTPWLEIKDHKDASNNFTWKPRREDTYEGSEGGPKAGPSNTIINEARKNDASLVTLFLVILPITFFLNISKMTQLYCYEEWVVETERRDRDNNIMKKKRLKICDRSTPNSRHRTENEKKKYEITPGFIMAWMSILIIMGAHFGSSKRDTRKLWKNSPYGLSIPYVQNAMPRNAFEFMRRYIHFADNSRRNEKGTPGYDALFKVRYVLDQIAEGLSKAWTAGKYVAIDESMIRYMGGAISFVQFMPAKPIKHGIKVFAICCALSAVLIGFEIYVGKEDDSDGSALATCDRLIVKANLHHAKGRILFTDNWYTSMNLAKHLFEKYRWTIVGTIVPTEKKSRQDQDIPFHKLSKGAVDKIKRGWYREAVYKMETPSRKKYYIQCTTWKDKKQVSFLHSHKVGVSPPDTVARHVKGKRSREVFPAPQAQVEYVKYFNAVDKNDRDSADYSTSIRTNRYYLRIFCWSFDRVLHALYVVVVCLAKMNIGNKEWKKYDSSNGGRHDFQIDLGIQFLNFAIDYDMKNMPVGKKPSWMRQSDPIPCNCDKCYFCITGMTTGIAHKTTKKRKIVIESYKTGERLTTKDCVEIRVDLKKGTQYCRMCYRNQPDTMSRSEKLKNSKSSRLGCPQCNEQVCKVCWEKGYDKHLK